MDTRVDIVVDGDVTEPKIYLTSYMSGGKMFYVHNSTIDRRKKEELVIDETKPFVFLDNANYSLIIPPPLDSTSLITITFNPDKPSFHTVTYCRMYDDSDEDFVNACFSAGIPFFEQTDSVSDDNMSYACVFRNSEDDMFLRMNGFDQHAMLVNMHDKTIHDFIPKNISEAIILNNIEMDNFLRW